ncbi:G-protein coupled receptor 83-like [Liolophura sinensis]|uniref:G-protein coupled receptor 83-like n=1 Tax=Liolophura sinensis TaxID=3198878 RepID=UPI0031585267
MTILSLAAADICIALFVIPGMVSAQFSERYMVNIICKICHYASHVSMSAASLSLVAVAGDRLKAIALPFKPKMTMGEVGIVVAVVWILSCAYGFRVPFLFEITPVLVQDDYGQVVSRMICSVPVADSQRNAPLVVLDFIIVFALPAITIAISYISLLYFLSKNSMQMGGKVSGAKKNKKALRLSIFMIAMFIFCHMPVHTFRLYLSRDHAIIPESFDLIRAFDIMSILNGVLNPIVYGFLNKQIRDAFLELVGRNGQRPSHTAHNRVHPTGLTDVDASKIATIIASHTQ